MGKSFLDLVEEKFGETYKIDKSRSDSLKDIKVISTGSLALDVSLGRGGIPRGRVTFVYGPPGCLSGDTIIKYMIKDKNGKKQNMKGGTLKNLYQRFNGLSRKGKGYYQRPETINSDFYVQSVNSLEEVWLNKIVNVMYSGFKECFEVILADGKKIVSTEDHKFMLQDLTFRSLGDLIVGDIVSVYNRSLINNGRKAVIHRQRLYVKYHPSEHKRYVDKYLYYTVAKSHAVFEAFKNNLEYNSYIKILNSNDVDYIKTLWTVPENFEIHHKDKNPLNDSISNLDLLSIKDHHKIHEEESISHIRRTIDFAKIISITAVGIKETFDIECTYPLNNFCANGFVVHNSAKTHLTLDIAKNAVLENNLNVLYIDMEGGLDQELVEAFFVGTEYVTDGDVINFTLTIPTGNYIRVMKAKVFEQGLEMCEDAIRSKEFGMVVVDSVSAGSPAEELKKDLTESTMMKQAQLISKLFRRDIFDIIYNEIAVVFISQVRDKVGAYIPTKIPTGGMAIQHYASVEIELRAMTSKDDLITEDDIPVGIYTKFSIKKNKLAPPFRSYIIPIIFGKGIDRLRDFVQFSEYLGILQKRGAYYVFDGETIGQGLIKTIDNLKTNKELLEKIKTATYSSLDKTKK